MGYPSSARVSGPPSTKIATTAANDSWNPASNSVYGFQASNTIAAKSSTCHASFDLPSSHAIDTAEPATAARTTDGCGPTASTYAPIAASAPT